MSTSKEPPSQPKFQTHFTYNSDQQWIPPSSSHNLPSTAPKAPVDPEAIRLMSWNIDMQIPLGNERMTAALQHLETLVTSTPPGIAVVIFLQEMTSRDLDLITSSPWIQDRFNITDKQTISWPTPYYGTTTLVDARLSIAGVFRVPFRSKYGRDGLFVDIALSRQSSSAETSSEVLRLCNVHLESLVADPPIRPHQLSTVSEYLHASKVACALVAGDFNAIEPFDRTLHTDNKLQDAFLSLGGKEDSDEGYTWGYQVPAQMRERFGCSRLDKIWFCGDVRAKSFDKIGVGIKEAGDEEWVSDHYGIMGDFEISNDWVLRTVGRGKEEE
ncbi:Endonuclease/exonuclease/phosphatase [Boeremia exigua]|uniref:Endonuclease/exonuclease/phosphatase n=1 Tax=Boeremia exigua TaxID=749465 RepID=UPI001E8EF264|nr:Endonuclease/exonuclease/phosphatase [Boeremia exigua]KAH6621903.1 Endonuclease/exonuclease/phosphatase [Boeremia exigua]